MKRPVLLDTNVLLWALNDDRRLTSRMKRALAAPLADIRVSVVSAWEIAIKYQRGRVGLKIPVEDLLNEILSGATWSVLPLLPSHVLELLELPTFHRDRSTVCKIAQARAEGMSLATVDSEIRRYEVSTIG